MGGELAFFQPFCSILGIIHGRFFEVQAGCKSNVSLGKRTRPLVHEVTDSFADFYSTVNFTPGKYSV